jgi:CspA family cold shock protein
VGAEPPRIPIHTLLDVRKANAPFPTRSDPEFSLRIGKLLTRTGESWGIASTTLSGRYDMTTETGTVKWFNESKGFGFIAPDNGGKDLFAHFKEIQGNGFKTLAENQRVEFEVTQGQKGPQASRIRVL